MTDPKFDGRPPKATWEVTFTRFFIFPLPIYLLGLYSYHEYWRIKRLDAWERKRRLEYLTQSGTSTSYPQSPSTLANTTNTTTTTTTKTSTNSEEGDLSCANELHPESWLNMLRLRMLRDLDAVRQEVRSIEGVRVLHRRLRVDVGRSNDGGDAFQGLHPTVIDALGLSEYRQAEQTTTTAVAETQGEGGPYSSPSVSRIRRDLLARSQFDASERFDALLSSPAWWWREFLVYAGEIPGHDRLRWVVRWKLRSLWDEFWTDVMDLVDEAPPLAILLGLTPDQDEMGEKFKLRLCEVYRRRVAAIDVEGLSSKWWWWGSPPRGKH